MEEMKNAWNVLVEKSEAKRPLGRPRSRWEDNTEMFRSSRNQLEGRGVD
jgi:hypothetical protein